MSQLAQGAGKDGGGAWILPAGRIGALPEKEDGEREIAGLTMTVTEVEANQWVVRAEVVGPFEVLDGIAVGESVGQTGGELKKAAPVVGMIANEIGKERLGRQLVALDHADCGFEIDHHTGVSLQSDRHRTPHAP